MNNRNLFKLRLYIAGDTENSAEAIANLTNICNTRLPGRHEIEVVDVFKEPKRALVDGIFMTPTLLVLSPPPLRRIVGTLSPTRAVLKSLGIGTMAA